MRKKVECGLFVYGMRVNEVGIILAVEVWVVQAPEQGLFAAIKDLNSDRVLAQLLTKPNIILI